MDTKSTTIGQVSSTLNTKLTSPKAHHVHCKAWPSF